MKKLLIALLPLLLVACSPEEESVSLRLTVTGNVSTALVQYAVNGSWNSVAAAEMPWSLDLQVEAGASLHLFARSENREASLVALVYHGEALVGQAMSCFCNLEYVSVEVILTGDDWPLQEI